MHDMILPCPDERYTKKYNEYLNDLGEKHPAGVITQTNYKAVQVAIKTLIQICGIIHANMMKSCTHNSDPIDFVNAAIKQCVKGKMQ
jgi:hypothetical protein